MTLFVFILDTPVHSSDPRPSITSLLCCHLLNMFFMPPSTANMQAPLLESQSGGRLFQFSEISSQKKDGHEI